MAWTERHHRELMTAFAMDRIIHPRRPEKVVPPDADDTLVLMACSAAKRDTPSVPLIDLYDGPMWQTLRLHRGEIPIRNIFVLSGKYGFQCASAYGSPYEEKISAKKVDDLILYGLDGQPRHRTKGYVLRATLLAEFPPRTKPFRTVISAGSGDYRRFFAWLVPALKEYGAITKDAPVWQTEGGIGTQRGQLGEFLRRVNGGPPVDGHCVA